MEPVQDFSGIMSVQMVSSISGTFANHVQDDRSEIDIEAVTPGTSIVNNTINYTLHPSLSDDGSPIPNATASVPISKVVGRLEDFHEYRFDCHPQKGVDFYVDERLQHSNRHNIPKFGGNLQLKLWADGNNWWSGAPSTTEVKLTVKKIIAYFNVTTPDPKWMETCKAAGGPSDKTTCEAD